MLRHLSDFRLGILDFSLNFSFQFLCVISVCAHDPAVSCPFMGIGGEFTYPDSEDLGGHWDSLLQYKNTIIICPFPSVIFSYCLYLYYPVLFLVSLVYSRSLLVIMLLFYCTHYYVLVTFVFIYACCPVLPRHLFMVHISKLHSPVVPQSACIPRFHSLC